MKLGVAEILKQVDEAKTKEDKITLLRKQDTNKVLKNLLYLGFNQEIKWLLPKGEVPYTPNQMPDQQGTLYAEARTMYLYIDGGNPNLQQTKREKLFIQLLEALDAEDAKVVASLKDKKLPYKTVTKKLIQEAYPDLKL